MLSTSDETLYGRIARVTSHKDFYVMCIRAGNVIKDTTAIATKDIMPKAEQWATVRFEGEMKGLSQRFGRTGLNYAEENGEQQEKARDCQSVS